MIQIRLPSLQKNRDEYYSGDPAFVQPADDATDEQKEAHARKWRVARETGNYADVAIEGARPVKFVMRPVPGSVYRKIMDRAFARQIGPLELYGLLLRCALVDIADCGDAKVRMAESEFGPIAPTDIIDALDAGAPGAVNELGALVMKHCEGPSPHR